MPNPQAWRLSKLVEQRVEAAMKLVLEGRKAPNGYTESLGKDSQHAIASHSQFRACFSVSFYLTRSEPSGSAHTSAACALPQSS